MEGAKTVVALLPAGIRTVKDPMFAVRAVSHARRMGQATFI